MKRIILFCVATLLVLVFSGTVYGQDLCDNYLDKYRVCVEDKNASGNLDFSECKGYTNLGSCEANGCYWSSDNNRCGISICLSDSSFDGDVNGSDFEVYKKEYGRRDCLATPDVPAPAPVPKTGCDTCYDSSGTPRDCTGTGEDGEHQKGVEWPNPRFTITYCYTNGPCPDQELDCDADPGTDVVTDNLTGLMWTRDAQIISGAMTWQQALTECNNLDFAGYDDWKLPNRNELKSLIHSSYFDPALPNTAGTGQWTEGDPFINVQSYYYWSSTTYASTTYYAWLARMKHGNVHYGNKSGLDYVWPVRGGND